MLTNPKVAYSIKELKSFEVKIGNIGKVADQALLNTWFSSRSYALSNINKHTDKILKRFENRGIGLYCKKDSFTRIVEAKKMRLPSSYASLQFNEWMR